MKNPLIGKLSYYKLNGKTFDTNGNEIPDTHEKDCFCCRAALMHLERLDKELEI